MTDATFRRSPSARDGLFWLDSRATGLPAYAVGVFPRALPPDRAAKPDVTLSEVLHWNPVFFFLGAALPSGSHDFAVSLATVALRVNPDGVSVAWLADPSSEPAIAGGIWLKSRRSNSGTLSNLLKGRSPPRYHLDADTTIPLTSHGLQLPRKAEIRVAAAVDGKGAALELVSEDGAALLGRAVESRVQNPAAFGPALRLELEGAHAGCLTGPLQADGKVLGSIGAVSRWRQDDRVLAFPVLYPAANLVLRAVIDPLTPQSAERCHLGLDPGTIARSGYRSRSGRDLELKAMADKAFPAGPRLILDSRGLGLQGPFQVSAPQSGSDRTVLCGLDGREVLMLADGAVFTFLLDTDGTHRVKISGPGENVHIQDAGIEVKTGGSRTTLTADTPPLPLAPYGFTAEDPALCRKLEDEVLAPARKRLLARPDLASPSYVTTRPGLPAPVSAEAPKKAIASGWSFPRAGEGEPPHSAVFGRPGDPNRLELSGLAPAEARSLESPDQNVIVGAGDGLIGSACEITFHGEKLRSLPGDWPASGTALIIKRTSGALKDMVSGDDWSALPNGDGGRRDRLRTILKDLSREVEDRAAADPVFRTLWRDVFLNKDWTGVLLANVPLADNGLPEPVRPMLDGLLSRISRRQTGGLWLALTYANEETFAKRGATLTAGNLDFAYPARSIPSPGLAAGIRRITAAPVDPADRGAGWRAGIEVVIEKLLGETLAPVSTPQGIGPLGIGPQGIGLLRIGVYRQAGEEDTLEAVTPTSFKGNGTLTDVTVTDLTMTSVATPSQIELRFALSGMLGFRQLPVDLLSFGRGDAKAAEGLAFSRLDLVVAIAAGQAEVSLDDTGLAVDSGASVARPGSLFANFPLGPVRLVRDMEGKPPGDLGFIAVACPAALGRADKGWLGLACRLELGTLGALAGNVGLVADLLIAWQPGAEGAQIGLRLPGSRSAKPEITLNGLVRLAFRGVALAATGSGEATAFTLSLEAIQIGMLGIGGFPPGRADLVLFGNPNGRQAIPSLGWYAAYAKTETE